MAENLDWSTAVSAGLCVDIDANIGGTPSDFGQSTDQVGPSTWARDRLLVSSNGDL